MYVTAATVGSPDPRGSLDTLHESFASHFAKLSVAMKWRPHNQPKLPVQTYATKNRLSPERLAVVVRSSLWDLLGSNHRDQQGDGDVARARSIQRCNPGCEEW